MGDAVWNLAATIGLPPLRLPLLYRELHMAGQQQCKIPRQRIDYFSYASSPEKESPISPIPVKPDKPRLCRIFIDVVERTEILLQTTKYPRKESLTPDMSRQILLSVIGLRKYAQNPLHYPRKRCAVSWLYD
jgi:hypothetical protein